MHAETACIQSFRRRRHNKLREFTAPRTRGHFAPMHPLTWRVTCTRCERSQAIVAAHEQDTKDSNRLLPAHRAPAGADDEIVVVVGGHGVLSAAHTTCHKISITGMTLFVRSTRCQCKKKKSRLETRQNLTRLLSNFEKNDRSTWAHGVVHATRGCSEAVHKMNIPEPPARMTSVPMWAKLVRGGAHVQAHSEETDNWARHGVGICFAPSDQGCLLIALMESGGPASRSGVCMVGDELLKIDGTVVEKAAVGSIRERVSGRAGTTLSLTLRRPRSGMQPMVYEVELVRGDAEFMAVQSRNKVLSREHSVLVAQMEGLRGQLQEKEAKLGDMMQDLSKFDTIASRAQEARRQSEEQRAQAEAEVVRLKKAQQNIDVHVDRLVAELREKERKLREFTGKGRSRSTSPVVNEADAERARSGNAVMGDASVPLNDSVAAGPAGVPTQDQLHAEIARTIAAKNEMQLRLSQQCALTLQSDARCTELEQAMKHQAGDLLHFLQAANELRTAEELAKDAVAAKNEAILLLGKAQQQLKEQWQQLQEHVEANAVLETQLFQARQELATLKQTQTLGSQQSANETQQLNHKLAETEAQLKEANEKLKSYSVRNEITMEGLNTEMVRCKQLSTAHEQMQSAHDNLQKQYTIAQQELAEATRQWAAEKQRAEDASQFGATLNEKSAATESLTLEKQALQQQLDSARKLREELEAGNLNLQKTIRQLEETVQVKNLMSKEECESMAGGLNERDAVLAKTKEHVLLLEQQLQKSTSVNAAEKDKMQVLQNELQKLKHELATVCLCIVTHDVDLSTLISHTEPVVPLGDPASGCKLYTRYLCCVCVCPCPCVCVCVIPERERS